VFPRITTTKLDSTIEQTRVRMMKIFVTIFKGNLPLGCDDSVPVASAGQTATPISMEV